MSISCINVERSRLVEKAALYGVKDFVLANIHPDAQHQYPLPSDYKFTPCFLPKKFERLSHRIQNFNIRSDDIWIVTFPKAGTTWILNIVWQLKNNLNFSSDYVDAAYNYFEGCILDDVNDENKDNTVYASCIEIADGRFNVIDNEPSPRIIKSHFPAHLLPKDIWTVKPKLIYMYRDPKDVAISMYHMFRNLEYLNFQGTMEEYFDIFLGDHVVYAPFKDHVNGFQKLGSLNHVLLLSYDEMIADPFAGVKQISEFLGLAYTDDQLQQLTQHVSFENMRESSRLNRSHHEYEFFRRGQSGGYRDEMSSEYIRKYDEWEKQNENST